MADFVLFVVLILVVLPLVAWSLTSAGRTIDKARAERGPRKPKGPCPYCGSPGHRKSWHAPGATR
jgi:hypothetical protein